MKGSKVVNSKERSRKVDLDSLPLEDFQRISEELSSQIRIICDQACEKANHLINPYGLKVQMNFTVLETQPPE